MKRFTIPTVIALTLLFLTNNLHAETHYMLANCMKPDNVCGDANKKRNEALKAARWHANKNKGAGSFTFILQADSDNTVTEYIFNYFQRVETFEGANGRNTSLPVMEVYLTREQYLTDAKKEAAEWLVSPNYNAKLFLQKTNVSSNDNATIDMDQLCGHRVAVRHPMTIVVDCRNALEDAGIYNFLDDTYQVALLKIITLTGSVKIAVNTLLTSVEATVAAEVNYEDAIKLTQQFGKPLPVVSSDGYQMMFVPMLNGDIVVKRFVVPPSINVKLDQRGKIINEDELIDDLENGRLQIDKSSKTFIDLMANRSARQHWAHLADMLENSIVCNYCKVKMTYPAPKKKKK